MESRIPPDGDDGRSGEPGRDGLHGLFQSRLDHRLKFFPSRSPATPRSRPEQADPRPVPQSPVPACEGIPGSVAIPRLAPAPDSAIAPAAEAAEQVAAPRLVPTSWERKKLGWNDDPSGPDTSGVTEPGPGIPRPGRPASVPTAERERRSNAERRDAFRYRVEGLRIAIGWPSGPANGGPGRSAFSQRERTHEASPQLQLIQHEADVIDISQSGLRVSLPHLPPADRGLWIGIHGTSPMGWSGVVLRSLSEPQPGQFHLGLSFVNDCPYELFKYVLLQPTADCIPG